MLPAAAYDLVAQRLHDARAASRRNHAELGRGVRRVLVALWSASAGTKALMSALNVAYEERGEARVPPLQPHRSAASPCAASSAWSLALSVIVGLPALLQLELARALAASSVPRGVSYLLLLAFVDAGALAALPLRAFAPRGALALGHAGLVRGGRAVARWPRSCSRSMSATSPPTTPPTARSAPSSCCCSGSTSRPSS